MSKFSYLMSCCAIVAVAAASPVQAQQSEFGSEELIEAAKSEGTLTFYTVVDAVSEGKVIAAFNEHFPEIRVELLRLPGGQMNTRVLTEAAAGRLEADVIDLSDTTDMMHLFAEYAPPNAERFPDEVHTDKLWGRGIAVWCLAHNTELVQDPPTSWTDLLEPEWEGQLALATILSGGGAWARDMFLRQTYGKEFWEQLAAQRPNVYPSGVPTADAIVRGEALAGPLLTNQANAQILAGAPLECIFPSDGIPGIPNATGIVADATSPNAARLFLNFALSEEGQEIVAREWGQFSTMRDGPRPAGAGPDATIWYPDRQEFIDLKQEWTDEWVRIFDYRL